MAESTVITQDWCGHPHYVCELCGVNTFVAAALDTHQCFPPGEPEIVSLSARSTEPSLSLSTPSKPASSLARKKGA